MPRCYVTGVGNLHGRSHTHHRGVAGGRWKKRAQKTARTFKPNLQPVTIIENGVRKRVRVTAKVLKRIRHDIAAGKKPVITIAKYASK
jgi:ribosomal protein L28